MKLPTGRRTAMLNLWAPAHFQTDQLSHPRTAAPRAAGQHDRRTRREDRMNPLEPLPRVRAGHRVFFHEQGEPLFGPGTFDLLVLVDETGVSPPGRQTHGHVVQQGVACHASGRGPPRTQAHDAPHRRAGRRRLGAHGRRALPMERFRAFLDEADADLARLYQKYFGDASFAQPEDASPSPDAAAPSRGGR